MGGGDWNEFSHARRSRRSADCIWYQAMQRTPCWGILGQKNKPSGWECRFHELGLLPKCKLSLLSKLSWTDLPIVSTSSRFSTQTRVDFVVKCHICGCNGGLLKRTSISKGSWSNLQCSRCEVKCKAYTHSRVHAAYCGLILIDFHWFHGFSWIFIDFHRFL